MAAKARGWCVTLNNYTEAELASLTRADQPQVRYWIVGREVGEGGTPHLQGYVYFHNAKTMAQTKAYVGERAHLERSAGSGPENRAYCSKDGNFTEHGELPSQGSRTDIAAVKKAILIDDRPLPAVIMECSGYQSMRTAELLDKYKPMKQREPPEVVWIWGATGTGKSRYCWEKMGTEDTWVSSKDLRWWQGYSGQRNVILDDFRADFCKFHELLRILDRYPYQVEYKGGSTYLRATRIYITSAWPPENIYKTIEDISQLSRRITKVIHLLPDRSIVFRPGTGTEVEGNTGPRLPTAAT